MYALSDKIAVSVYFGGTFSEHWTEDYKLTVSYEGRSSVTGFLDKAGWIPERELPDSPLSREYFEAVCAGEFAVLQCTAAGVSMDRLSDFYSCEGGVAPYELLRILLDENGLGFEDAVEIILHCCGIIRPVDFEELCKLNPRTAALSSFLGDYMRNNLFAAHNSRDESFRSPPGALKAGAMLSLSVFCTQCERAELFIYGDDGSVSYEMPGGDGLFKVNITLQDSPAALWYRFVLHTPFGTRYLVPDWSGFRGVLSENPSEGFRLTVYRQDFHTPDWFKKSVMYQIFPDRFAFSSDNTAEKGIEYHKALGQTPQLHKSLDEPLRYLPREFEKDYAPDDFYGGTLRGIMERLPYLKELGVSVVYINPIVEARSNHRYDTSDYLTVDPVLGTNEDFIALSEAAERFGIRLILDGVFSHTGADSVYFNKNGSYPAIGACQGSGSPYYPWYRFSEFPSKYKCWWNFADLPEVNENDKSWQDFIITGANSVVKTWLRRGAAGWRLDVADELPDCVLALIRQSAKEENPDAVILGEVWEDAVLKVSYGSRRNYALGNSLDSVMNYPLRKTVLDFLHGHIPARNLVDFLDSQRLNYPPELYYSLMNLMGSHDVERLRTNLSCPVEVKFFSRQAQADFVPESSSDEIAKELCKLAAAIQFSLPGVPSIYYGDEQGMTGCGDPFNRAPFHESPDAPLSDYKALSKIRSAHEVMSTGYARFSHFGDDVLIICRYGAESEIYTLINRAPDPRGVILPRGRNLQTGENTPTEFSIPPRRALIIERL